MKKLLLSWSSGKDSAWALHRLRQQSDYEVVGLLTTLNAAFDRVAMHSTRRALVEAQAAAAELPLTIIPLPWPCSNDHYEAAMSAACAQAVANGVEAMAFGDLFLEDIRQYRIDKLKGTGIEPIFPVWGAADGIATRRLAEEMIAGGLRARLVCVDPKKLSSEFAGRDFDAALLRDLPPGVDPCGENGEFHTAVYAGPMFREPIPFESGEIVTRDGFVFADVRVADPVGA
jgi:uncharacterized protein (TIGR00290 family)